MGQQMKKQPKTREKLATVSSADTLLDFASAACLPQHLQALQRGVENQGVTQMHKVQVKAQC